MSSLRLLLPSSLAGALLGAGLFGQGEIFSRVEPVPEAEGMLGAVSGQYAWPVSGPVIRGFDPPGEPFAAGHRGIDIGAAPGTPVRAAHDGVVAFSGPVGGDLYVSVDHRDGIRTTYSWLSSIAVRRGEEVRREGVIGTTGPGHPGVEPPHLHFGARTGDSYIDPMTLLEPQTVVGLIRLAPVHEQQI